ncbi:MAG: hypothetical protein HY260_12515 [Chloroflexi bacterium]|nr:hypothetical protein [Chloroflexota bacterium]
MSITRREWLWVSIAATLVMALTTIPYAMGLSRSDADWHFSGFVFGVDDGNSYIGKMALGARGEWLFHLFYTTEPHRPIVAFGFHLLLGRLAVLFAPPTDPIALHDRLVTWYHAARIVCGFALLLVSYRFCAEFLRFRSQRRLAFILIALGGGLGWLLALARVGGLPIDFYSPEAFTFLDLYGLPHLSAARVLLLAGLIFYLRGIGRSTESRKSDSSPSSFFPRSVPSSFLWLLLGLIQPLYVLVGYAILAAHIVALSLFRLPVRRALTAAIIIGLISSPMVLYTAYVFRADPILAQWQRQNTIVSPNPLHYLAGWGLWLVPAIPGAISIIRRFSWPRHSSPVTRHPSPATRHASLLLIGWLAVVPFLLYLPYNLQRRLAEGAQLPVVCLAVIGLTVGLAPWIRKRARRWIAIGVTGLSVPTTAMLLFGGMIAASRPAPPIFLPGDEIAAFRWLAEHAAPGDAVLSTFEIGNALPAYAPVVVYLCHGPETAFADRKRAEVQTFFRVETSDDARRTLLNAGGINFVVFDGPARSGVFDPESAGYLQRQFEIGEFAAYRVRR